MRKITQMVGREKERLGIYKPTQTETRSYVWLIRGRQVVVPLPFHSSTRIRLKNMGQIKDTKKYFRYERFLQIIKEQIVSTFKTPDFNLYFDSGIDDKGSWLQVMKDHKLVKVGSFSGTPFNLKVRTLSSNLKTSKKYWMKDLNLKITCMKKYVKHQS